MKNFSLQLIFLSFFQVLTKNFLPKGEKSPLYGPLKFLLSLSLIICILSPFLSLLKTSPDLPEFSLSDSAVPKGEELVLERVRNHIEESVKNAYPNTKFSLTLESGENFVPQKIKLSCQDPSAAQNIKDYIKIKYALECEISKR